MKQLIAVSRLLFESTNFEPGDELPEHNAGLVEIWLKSGTAVWKDTEAPKKRGVKARQAAAPAGIPGGAYPSAGPGQDLAGIPPGRKARGIVPEPSRGKRKPHA